MKGNAKTIIDEMALAALDIIRRLDNAGMEQLEKFAERIRVNATHKQKKQAGGAAQGCPE